MPGCQSDEVSGSARVGPDRGLAHRTSDLRPPTSGSPRRVDVGEALIALGAVAFGVAVIWQTTQIRLTPAYSLVGPRVIPYIVGAGLVLSGLWLAVESMRGHGATVSTESEDADPTLPTDWRSLGLIAVALIAYLVLLEPAGFIVASTVLFVVAAFAMGSRRLARDVAFGILISSALYVGFTRGLDLQLPAGVLAGIL